MPRICLHVQKFQWKKKLKVPRRKLTGCFKVEVNKLYVNSQRVFLINKLSHSPKKGKKQIAYFIYTVLIIVFSYQTIMDVGYYFNQTLP